MSDGKSRWGKLSIVFSSLVLHFGSTYGRPLWALIITHLPPSTSVGGGSESAPGSALAPRLTSPFLQAFSLPVN